MSLARAALLLPAALALGGCVAAVVPIVAAGMIGKTQADRAGGRDAARTARAEAPTKAPTVPPTVAPAASDPVPAARVTAGDVVVLTDMTALPPPSGAPARSPGGTIVPPPSSLVEQPRTADAWRAMLRYVAAAMLERPAIDALGAPGCAARAPAVAIDAAAADLGPGDREAALNVLRALRTMEVAVLFVGEGAAARALAGAGLGETGSAPAEIAGLARRYCLLAIGSSRRDAAMLGAANEPRWGDGWFLLGASGRSTGIEEGQGG